jgi:hypothetical protein
VVGVCAGLATICILQGVLSPWIIGTIDEGIHGPDHESTVPSPFSTSISTLLGYLGFLIALAIWSRKELVYRTLTEGSLSFVGLLGRKELYIDEVYLSISRAVVGASRTTGLLASGQPRDYTAYVMVAWLVGMLLILGGIL